MNKTFAKLGYKVGDTVRCIVGDGNYPYKFDTKYTLETFEQVPVIKGGYNGHSASWELVSRAGSTEADDKYLIWGDMTPEAQGALLLAAHNGASIQDFDGVDWGVSVFTGWYYHVKYRVKPADPVVVTHELFGKHGFFWSLIAHKGDTHKMTYNTIDGVIDCASVKMVEIDKP